MFLLLPHRARCCCMYARPMAPSVTALSHRSSIAGSNTVRTLTAAHTVLAARCQPPSSAGSRCQLGSSWTHSTGQLALQSCGAATQRRRSAQRGSPPFLSSWLSPAGLSSVGLCHMQSMEHSARQAHTTGAPPVLGTPKTMGSASTQLKWPPFGLVHRPP